MGGIPFMVYTVYLLNDRHTLMRGDSHQQNIQFTSVAAIHTVKWLTSLPPSPS